MLIGAVAKELGIQQVGSFRCLNGKVDLSTHEAEHTLVTWEARLQKLRQEVRARTIAKNISAANAPYSVKVLAYRNGDGRLKQPEMIIGSSVPGVSEIFFSMMIIRFSVPGVSTIHFNDHWILYSRGQ